MARPLSSGLAYFPHDTDTERDLEFVEAKHGGIGYSIYFKLLERIYDDGYYIEWSNRLCVVLAKKWSCDRWPLAPEYLQEVVGDLLSEGLFSQELYEQHGILTSAAVQRRFVGGCYRRSKIYIREDYLLASIELPSHARVQVVVTTPTGTVSYVIQNPSSGNQNPDNGNHNPSSGLQKSGEREREQSEIESKAAASAQFHVWLKTWAAENPKIRNASAFVRKVLKEPLAYPDIVEQFEAAIARASPRPDPPGTCDVCGSSEIDVDGATAECQACRRMWAYASGTWKPMTGTGKVPVPAVGEDFEDFEDEPG